MSCQIGRRWTPFHITIRREDGSFEEVNSPRGAVTGTREQAFAAWSEELAAWFLGCVIAILLAGFGIMLEPSEAVRHVLEVVGVLSFALMAGLVPWAIWGGPKP